MSVQLIRGNALDLPLTDGSVDLVVTSPPYFGLRSYQDDGQHYGGQIGSEPTPAGFVDALIAATAEMVRVLKPSGSIWVNLGDKYAGAPSGPRQGMPDGATRKAEAHIFQTRHRMQAQVPAKSLIGVPWRYALRCIDDLGLILRAEVIWSKPNGLPESVTDRVRRSHETWFHMTREPRYYSAVDEIREGYSPLTVRTYPTRSGDPNTTNHGTGNSSLRLADNPLGKLPGSVWSIATQPLTVPASLGVDHFAAFPMEWPRRLIAGWCPREVCSGCGEGRRPTTDRVQTARSPGAIQHIGHQDPRAKEQNRQTRASIVSTRTITGDTCACTDLSAPSIPGTVLDPFGGTGTTALVADSLGRHGISVDMSADYCRLAAWRTTDPGQRASALQVDKTAAVDAAGLSVAGQIDLFGAVS